MSKTKQTFDNQEQGNSYLGVVRQRLLIGDRIRDIEDGDCYYEGIVVGINPVKYEITNVLWCDEEDESMNGQVSELKWWFLERLVDNKWVRLNVA